jgi:pentose-5-phosphate-3-epimerase
LPFEPLRGGADLVTVHIVHRPAALPQLRHTFGLVNPPRPLAPSPVRRAVRPVVVMSVVPGFGGQQFIPEAPPR